MDRAAVADRLKRLTPQQRDTCVSLLSDDPARLALRTGASYKTILQRRRRAELRLGFRLPRTNRRGRPSKLLTISDLGAGHSGPNPGAMVCPASPHLFAPDFSGVAA